MASLERKTRLLQRDTDMLKRLYALWRVRPHLKGGTVHLPSGRTMVFKRRLRKVERLSFQTEYEVDA